jgi:4-amino-4-deoxy-L-arabinose transferase-like glycosyltransferase
MKDKKYFEWAFFPLIIFLASFLRLIHITKRDFWYDEAFTGITIRDNFSGMMKIITNDVHPPLYYILVKYFSALFNYNVLGIRLFSAIFGVLCVIAIYAFTKELFDKKTALWASFLTTIGPLVIQYSQEARMYSMYSFLIIMASYFFLKALKTNKKLFYLLWGFFWVIAILTHYMSLIFAPIFYFVFVIWNFKATNLKDNKKIALHFIKSLMPNTNLMLGYVLAFLIFLPWIPNFLKNLSQTDFDWIKPTSFSDIFYNIQMFLFGVPPGEMSAGMPSANAFYGVSQTTILTFLTIFLTLVMTYLIFFKKEIRKTLIITFFSFGFMFIVYLLSLIGEYYFIPRYLLPASYFLFVFLASWLAKIRFRYSFSLIVFYVLILSFVIIPVQASTGWHAMTKNLKKYEGKNFYSLNSFDYVIAKYYLGDERLSLYNIDWPQYNPYFWAAIGTNLKRTENYADIKNDPNALIIYNVQVDRKYRSDKTFFPEKDGLTLVDQYKNILIYKF